MVSLCIALSSDDVVKVTTNRGLSKACAGVVDPIQRTVRNVAKLSRSDCRLV